MWAPNRWPHEALERTFAQLFPQEVFKSFKFLFIKDVVNAAPFTAHVEWREEMQLEVAGPLPLLMLSRDVMGHVDQRHRTSLAPWAVTRLAGYLYGQTL